MTNALQPQRTTDELLELLLQRLPAPIQSVIVWLRRPDRRWVRIPAGLAFMLGGVLSILPILGLWMLPVGILLLSQDIPVFRRLLDRCLRWVEQKHPSWMGLTTDE